MLAELAASIYQPELLEVFISFLFPTYPGTFALQYLHL